MNKKRVKNLLRKFRHSRVMSILTPSAESKTRHEDVFTKRYGLRQLKDPKEGSYSGPGSTVARTEAIREAIPQLLKDIECKTLIDAPCGDLKWMQTIQLPVEKYIGVEVIKDLVDINTKSYANEQRSFLHLDLVEQVLPQGDVVLNRDMLIHLSYKDIVKFLRLLKRSNSTYLLTSHFPEQVSNTDITTGEWRPINLEIAPFKFPAPILTISERYTQNKQHADKCLALWKIKDIPKY